MKVLDLHCGLDHRFEGWFASEDDFQSQLARALVECPVCGDKTIHKALSAPRLNLGAREPQAPASAPAQAGTSMVAGSAPQALQAAWLRMVREVMAQTEDVGERFAEEARRMHYGEADERSIRGQATRQEAVELLEEGIPVLPLPVPAGLKGPVQ